jgi:uncharacterized membrane protein YdbT with pleckstrin-like domain
MKEQILFKTNPHWLLLVFPEVLGVLLTGVSLRYLPPLLLKMECFSPLILVIFGGVLVFLMIVIFLEWICTKYYLTDLRLTEKRGVIGKRIVSIPLDKIQDVKCEFGIIGRIFGFGDLEIESAGTLGKIIFHFIPSPERFQEKIQKTVLKSKKRETGESLS